MAQQLPQTPLVESRPQPNIYTVLILIAVLALGLTVGLVFSNLTAAPPDGYGLKFEQLFDPITKLFDAPK